MLAPFAAGLLATVTGYLACDADAPPYDPIAVARASIGHTANREAQVPSMCYTKTGGVSNPCWTCHTDSQSPNHQNDGALQAEYSFSAFALQNRWTNLFVDRTAAATAITDAEALAYIRTDNYAPLRAALNRSRPADYTGYVPDLDLAAGFDAEGFARDGSGWRALRYKPFPGTFWPTNGSADDVMVRLPAAFRASPDGTPTRDIYKANLAILEAAIASPPGGSSTIAARFVGAARDEPVRRRLFPAGTELLHTVRYVDPDAPALLSTRLKELRYMRKVASLDDWAVLRAYEKERDKKDRGVVSAFAGSPLSGVRNDFGWQLQGFIEDATGRLRLQTEEEHRFCMGCHSSLGVTVDQTFSFARKVPGADGWRHQDLRGMKDAPQAGHAEPEILTYFKRTGGGDELRANVEVLQRFFPGGILEEKEVRRAAPGGDRDITHLIAPSRSRALALAKSYMALVREQTFAHGRDTLLAPPANVFARIDNDSTELATRGKIFRDGRLWLDWN